MPRHTDILTTDAPETAAIHRGTLLAYPGRPMLPVALILLAACREAPANTRTLTLAAYTAPREAYAAILPRFAADWEARTGQHLRFEESYQGSGAQARAVRDGFEADVVALSLDPDVRTLEDAGLVTHDWRNGPHGGMVTRSVVAIAVRPGNPEGIHDWSDLARAGVEVLTPNVRTSGGAMWNVAAVWGAAPESAGEALLAGILANVQVMDKGARESLVSFERGVGDAAITYESEIRVAQAEGRAMEAVVPPRTLLIANPLVVVDTWANRHGNRDLAEAFVAYCQSPEAQAIFVAHGARASGEGRRDLGAEGVPPSATPPPGVVSPNPSGIFTIADLGGWKHLKTELFQKGGVYDRALATARARGSTP